MYMPMAGPSDDSAANPGMFTSHLQFSEIHRVRPSDGAAASDRIFGCFAVKCHRQKQWKKQGGRLSATNLQPGSCRQMQRVSAQPLRPAQGSGGGGTGHDQVQLGDVQVQLS
jgi:hypothetical protein